MTKEIADVQFILNEANLSARKSVEIDTDDIDSYMKALQTEESRGKKSAAALRVIIRTIQSSTRNKHPVPYLSTVYLLLIACFVFSYS